MPDTAAWERHLQDVPRAVNLPADRTTGAPDAGPVVREVPGGPYPAGDLLAGVGALLYRYGGEPRLLVGRAVPATGRLLAVQLTVDGGQTGAELRDAAAQAVVAAADLGEVTHAELAELRGLDPAGGQCPCHAVVTDGPPEQAAPEAAELTVTTTAQGRTALVADPRFAPATVERLAEHLGRLLTALAGDADVRVAELPLLGADERAAILYDWNDTAREFPPEQFPELVARVAREAPERPAIVYGDRVLSYGDLDSGANRLAQHLAGLGVGRGDRVGVCLERCPESILAQLATFRLAATAVLLDPEYPQERLEFMVDDSRAAAVLTRAGLRGRLGDVACPVVLVEGDEWRSAPAVDPGCPVADEEVCHIAYTSGSTGRPKAVQLRHGPLRNTVHVLREQCGLAPGQRGTWLCSPGFGLVQVDCFPILSVGGTVHIPEPSVAASPEQLRDWLVEQRITQSLVLTAMAERLWRLDWPADPALRWMRIAGERVRSWPDPALPFRVLNVYGSAEATVVGTCDLSGLAAEAPEGRPDRMPPVGRPVANVRAYVLDANRQPVPPGVLGELYISGESLSRGYLNRPEANGTKFLPNELPGDPYPVLYRSGDVARYWPDGTVEIVGRTDNEVKIRGYRVHLGEIESVLAEQPGVRQCAVLAREDTPGERRLVAYIEPDRARPPEMTAVRGALRRLLPTYMLPAAYVVDDLPTTANGKIDRAVLSPPPRTRPELDTPYRAPQGPAQERVARIWAEVLDLDEIGVDDDFFELGGDSLRAMRLLARLRDEAQLRWKMSELFRTPTVAALVDRAGARRAPAVVAHDEAGLVVAHDDAGLVVAHDEAGRHEPFGLDAAQAALLGGPGVRYVEWRRDWLDVDRFVAAWQCLLQRQDALRLVLATDGTQRVAEFAPAPPPVLDLTGAGDDEAADRLDLVRAELLAEPFDLRQGPPHRLRLTLLPDDVVAVHLAVHPAVADDRSLDEVVPRLLAAGYEDLDGPAPEVTVRDLLRGGDSPSAVDGPFGAPVAPDPARRQSAIADGWRALTAAARHAGTTPDELLGELSAGAYAEVTGTPATRLPAPAGAPAVARDVVGPLTGGPAVSGPVVAVRLLPADDGGEDWTPARRANLLPGVAADLTARVDGAGLCLDWTCERAALAPELLDRVDAALRARLAAPAALPPAPAPVGG
ncbi:non-ribosomal peptide synthetase [Micromonospora rubida]|uniref:non-ribosomal peptide synthetase n=1 Tax=Micromonospora rubida TaxID=2697657 RepID=UPI001377E027|nr:amino acid adenylation domain-containing protein [Micromonospora rubida]NBE83281.1 amino acid adenylation domain-containing protein [Micromonospora rubida]